MSLHAGIFGVGVLVLQEIADHKVVNAALHGAIITPTKRKSKKKLYTKARESSSVAAENPVAQDWFQTAKAKKAKEVKAKAKQKGRQS